MDKLKTWVVGVFANRYIAKVAAPILKVVGFLDGKKTYLSTSAGALSALAVLVDHANRLFADGIQVADLKELAESPEYLVLAGFLTLLFKRLAQSKLAAKLDQIAAQQAGK